MDSNISELDSQEQAPNEALPFLHASKLTHKTLFVPSKFIWPKGDIVEAYGKLSEPYVDLEGFLKGDKKATLEASKLVRKACLEHGFFQVTNHGVDQNLLATALLEMGPIFNLPFNVKTRASQSHPAKMWGFSTAHSNRFSSKLPWKETFSFGFDHCNSFNNEPSVVDFFSSALGKEFKEIGVIYEKYCEAMRDLSLALTELLGISLGLERSHFRMFFEDGSSIMRLNSYPICEQGGVALGTGPHCDPTALTILHQDQVGGLEVFANNLWHSVPPSPNALVVNIGDLLMAQCNGEYKSCVHRAVVNQHKKRRSLAFFLCPRKDKVVRPPEKLISDDESRKYPDFSWSELLEFTQKHYRADAATLQNFTKWVVSSRPWGL
ncbi:gibberellin 20 oxidase 3 [Cucumis melo var. makuwa]|uniref:Gibberellin 20 oxidase 3 n=1 Tax=Cucumis melo var. makuwa TaxID=1194695 RepID=A0A5D3D529_CUCMM|nr:gibberellin 20 oxidase 3 [Cucumis melo var. makuwa]